MKTKAINCCDQTLIGKNNVKSKAVGDIKRYVIHKEPEIAFKSFGDTL